MDGSQIEDMEVEPSEHIDMSAINWDNSNAPPSEESQSGDPFGKPEDDKEANEENTNKPPKKNEGGTSGTENNVAEDDGSGSKETAEGESEEKTETASGSKEKTGATESSSEEKKGTALDSEKEDSTEGEIRKNKKKDVNKDSKETTNGKDKSSETATNGKDKNSETATNGKDKNSEAAESEKANKDVEGKDNSSVLEESDLTVVMLDENEEQCNQDSNKENDKEREMEWDTLGSKDKDSVEGMDDKANDSIEELKVGETGASEETETNNASENVDPETKDGDKRESTASNDVEIVESKKDKEKAKGKSEDADEEIIELPIYKKPAVVVDLSTEEEEAERKKRNEKNIAELSSENDESNADKNKRIKLRSLASLVDANSSQDIPAIGEIVEHGVIIGSDEMDGLQLRISNVVGGEDCITGLTIDEDRDSFPSIQISSVTTLMEPISPEDPNKESSKSDEIDGEGGEAGTDSSSSDTQNAGKGIQIVNSESLTSKEGTDGNKTSAESQLNNATSRNNVDTSQKAAVCVYHVLRSILTVNRDCLVCGKSVLCEFRVTKKGESGTWAFICSSKCRSQWRDSLPADHQVEKPRLIFEKLCGMCGKDLANINRSGQFSWETREFCSRKCLTQHLKEVAGECHMCHEEVRPMFIAKYCVRFGSDIHQFCSNSCLERYKTKIKVCCYCQKNLEKVSRVTSMANKEYCSMKCLKRAQRRDIGQQNYSEQHPCTVCVATGLNRYEFLSNQETFQLCSDPCLNVYKYANKVKAVSCCLCFRVMNAEDVGHYLYQGGLQLRVFCSDSCVNVFILSARKIVVCNYCKVKKYNFDMIHRQVDEDFREYFYCSLNCLNVKEPHGKSSDNVDSNSTSGDSHLSSEASDNHVTTCNMCNIMAKPQYHMVMSDNTLRSFCRFACASKYKTTYGYQINGIQNNDSTQQDRPLSVLRPKPTTDVASNAVVNSESASKSKNNSANVSSNVSSQTVAELLTLLNPPMMANKMTSCRPGTVTKGVYCKPHPWHRYTQTDQSEAGNVAPRSRGGLTSSQIRELLDLGAQSEILSESEVGGLGEYESDGSGSDYEDDATSDSSRKRKESPDSMEGANEAKKSKISPPSLHRTASSYLPVYSGERCILQQQAWEWDFTSKFIPVYKAFNASSSGIPENCNISDDSSELDFFCLFFNKEIMDHICRATRRYHQQKQEANEVPEQDGESPWDEPSVDEMYCFLGLVMLMAHVKKNIVEDYWMIDPLLNSPVFHKLMTKKRFKDILQNLHFASDIEINQSSKLAKIRPVLNHIKKKFKETFKPFKDLSINESLALCEGHSVNRPYTPKKQHKLGVECFVLSDLKTGVVVDIEVYAGTPSQNSSNEFGYGGAAIEKLLFNYDNKNSVLYLDHWYASPLLFNYLHKKGIEAVGVVRSSRKYMPKFRKVKRGCTASAHSHGVVAVKWAEKQKQNTHVLSTIHEDVMTDCGKADAALGLVEKMPKVLEDYRTKMQIEDHSCVMVTNIDWVQKLELWYQKFFFHLLDLVVLNAYHLYCIKTCSKPVFSDFQGNVVRQLFEKFVVEPKSTNQDDSTPQRLNAPHYPASLSSSDSTDQGQPCHVCAHTELSEKKKSMTKTMCMECNVPLCSFPCFGNYHKLSQF